ncbi:glycosyltransferase family 2 protein [uncultured Amnibacterium sp.]|uniref:glycosyltransferase family 2 protein n=1 Tax=uncultured Amnibacterium sp. TaxID=1631851 RepID=UPI0035CC0935
MIADVILPCLDEALALPGVLAAIPPGCRAIVVDNGSTDGSAEVARAHGALVVAEPRRGFGAAVHAGVLAAEADLVAILDADGSLDPADLPRLAAPVLAGEADLVLGRRRPMPRSAWPLHARLANRALAAAIRRASGVAVHDLGPMRVARRADLLALDLRDRRSGYPLEMLLAASASGLRVREVDVPYRPRIGRSKVTGTVRGTLTAVRDMRRILKEHGADPLNRSSAPNP